MNIYTILQEYLAGCAELGLTVPRKRVLLGRSDPALSYGLVAAVLGCKVALAEMTRLSADTGTSFLPILGAGALPFRGHVTLDNLDHLLREFPGLYTVILQSGLRYDHGPGAARDVAAALKVRLPTPKPTYTSEQLAGMRRAAGVFAKHFLETAALITDVVCKLSDLIPPQRDRLTRISPVGYARDVARPEALAALVGDDDLAAELRALQAAVPHRADLPRTITYTAAMYSAGLPPELLGTGHGLAEMARRYGSDSVAALREWYPSLRDDVAFAARFTYLGNALPARGHGTNPRRRGRDTPVSGGGRDHRRPRRILLPDAHGNGAADAPTTTRHRSGGRTRARGPGKTGTGMVAPDGEVAGEPGMRNRRTRLAVLRSERKEKGGERKGVTIDL